MFRSETISISIDCPHQEVYEFLLEPLNLPTWGSNIGLAHVMRKDRAAPDRFSDMQSPL